MLITTPEDAAEEMCAILGLAFYSIGDFGSPCDGFCLRCPNGIGSGREHYYRNSGEVIEYVRTAVVEKLKRDGHKIADGFDPCTGEEVR